MIVLNGEPFLRYNLRSLYPFAHQIIVVEGAAPDAKNIATSTGHSTDSTLVTLRDFKRSEDPHGKLLIVTAEDEGHENGFWSGEKDEQSKAYAKRATGDYLWQVDSDEFYKPKDMQKIISLLESNPQITAVSFPMITFWGGLSYWVDGWYLRRGASEYHRLFKWGTGYQYVTHRPPTVHDRDGRDLRKLIWLRRVDLLRIGIHLYHYSLLFPRQVYEKSEYYDSAKWAMRTRALSWANENFMELKHPYRVHNVYDYPSWLNRFNGSHPPQILDMFEDIKEGRLIEKLRQTDDVERLLSSLLYKLGGLVLIFGDYPDRVAKLMLNTFWVSFWKMRDILRFVFKAVKNERSKNKKNEKNENSSS